MVTEDAYSSTLGLLNAEINKTKTRNKNRKIFNLRKLQEKWQIMHVKAFNATWSNGKIEFVLKGVALMETFLGSLDIHFAHDSQKIKNTNKNLGALCSII